MGKSLSIISLAALSLAAVPSCAVSDDSTDNEAAKTYMEAWISINHPDATLEGRGIWVLSDEGGEGGAQYNGENYIIIDYTLSGMAGTISETTSEDVAKQLGTYNESYYYGPHTIYAADETLPVGVEDMVAGMRVGETKKALIPLWLMGTTRYKDDDEYIEHTPENVYTTVYEITLRDFADDIIAYQNDSLEAYSAHNYGGLDSLQLGFYYKQLSAPTSTEDFPSDTTIYINYIGRLLNGRVFDTTIADTAKKYGLYSSSTTYEPVLINWGEDYSDLTMTSSESSIISGFGLALWQMHPYEKGVAFFNSNYGYSYSGSGSTIPAYSPLLFEVEITDEP